MEDAEVGTQDRMPHLDVAADLGAVQIVEIRVPDQYLEGVELGDELQGRSADLDDARARRGPTSNPSNAVL